MFTNNPSRRWPYGEVPYVIEGSFGKQCNGINLGKISFLPSFSIYNLDLGAHSRINQTASKFNSVTGGCIRWVPRSNQSDYVGIQNSASNCWSVVGRNGGRQPLNLGNGCTGSGTIEHEMLHALGMWHEQSRPDR